MIMRENDMQIDQDNKTCNAICVHKTEICVREKRVMSAAWSDITLPNILADDSVIMYVPLYVYSVF